VNEFLQGAAAVVVVLVAVGLVRALRGPTHADRLMAVQLLGSGGIGALVLWAVAQRDFAVLDVALTLAVLAAFASIALVKFAPGIATEPDPGGDARDDR